jgi:hypothetical protein
MVLRISSRLRRRVVTVRISAMLRPFGPQRGKHRRIPNVRCFEAHQHLGDGGIHFFRHLRHKTGEAGDESPSGTGMNRIAIIL